MLTVTDPASDLTLLTIEEARLAYGVTGSSMDATVQMFEQRVAIVIANACNIASDGIAVPTIKLETLSEVRRLGCSLPVLLLARRFVKAITSVTVDGTVLDPADYEVDRVAGMLYRLENDRRVEWAAGKVTIVYEAGLETIPSDVKLAASKLMASYKSETGRDPNLKREKVEGVSEMEYWVGSKDDPAVPSDVMDILSRYMNPAIG